MNKYYKILGVTEENTKDEIKSAYRNLLKKYHPDTYPGDKNFAVKKTSEINVAYAQVLADLEKIGAARPKKEATRRKETIKPKKEEVKTKVRPETFAEEQQKDNQKKSFKNIFEKYEKSKADLEKYANQTAENAESNIAELFKTEEEKKSEKKSKRALDALIISLSILTIIMILLFIFL